MDVSKFNEKLNKVDGNTYVIEEVATPVNGVYEEELAHDNITISTLNIYTGSKLTGDKINTYTTSTPSLAPWKTVIKIFSTITPLYISYEFSGDEVEAEDINNLQDAVVDTQENLNNEIDRTIGAEKVLTDGLNAEVTRAKASEKTISDNLANEATRAKDAENTLTINIGNETTRAKAAEKTLTDNLSNEVNRASSAENAITNNLNTTNNNLGNEITRSKNAESTLTTNLTNEVSRASTAEATLTNNLNSEITRAKAAENTITNTINTNKPTWDDKYTKNEVDNKINQVVSNMDYKEHVPTVADLATTYPNAQDGWTVSVDADNITYKYNGSSWISISANSIPLATKDVDGKMSKQDKIDHDDMNSKKHIHSNKSIIDIITQTLIDNWNSAYAHIIDAVKHITSTERTLWNTVSNKVDKTTGKSLSTNDFDNNYKAKVDGIEIIQAGEYVNYKSSGTLKIESNGLGYIKIFRKITIIKGTIRLKLDYWDSGNSTTHVQIYLNDNSIGEYSSNSATQSISIDVAVNENDVLEIGGYSDAGTCNIDNIKLCTDKNIPYFGNSNAGIIGKLSAEEIGAMSKAVYDADGDGVVDNADTVDGKHASDFALLVHGNHVPTVQTASNSIFLRNDNTWQSITPDNIGASANTHTHTKILYNDTRSVNMNPDAYSGLSVHLKANGIDGINDGGAYHGVMHIQQWNDISGGMFHQLSFTDNGHMYHRTSTNATTWGSWERIITNKQGLTWNDIEGV